MSDEPTAPKPDEFAVKVRFDTEHFERELRKFVEDYRKPDPRLGHPSGGGGGGSLGGPVRIDRMGREDGGNPSSVDQMGTGGPVPRGGPIGRDDVSVMVGTAHIPITREVAEELIGYDPVKWDPALFVKDPIPPFPTRVDRHPDDQPLPTTSDAPVAHRMVQDDLDARLALGIERYGQPLQPFNGRSHLRDAYEEILDLAVYLRAAIYEQENPQ